MKRRALLVEFYRRPLASSPDERQKNQMLTLIFTFYLLVLPVYHSRFFGVKYLKYATKKSSSDMFGHYVQLPSS